MIYALFDRLGNQLNTIVSDLDFVEAYCQQNGYTFAKIEEDTPAPGSNEDQEESIWKELDEAYSEGVNSAYDA